VASSAPVGTTRTMGMTSLRSAPGRPYISLAGRFWVIVYSE